MNPLEPQFHTGANKLQDFLLFHAEEEASHRVMNPLSKKDDPNTLEHLKKQYENLLLAVRKDKKLNPEEKKTRQYLRHEIRRINAKQHPNVLLSILFSRPVNWLWNTLLRRQQNFSRHRKILDASQKSTILEYNNVQLHRQMEGAGFKGRLDKSLQRSMSLNLPEFSLRHTQPDAPNAHYLLHFQKIPGTDAYYFKSYDVMMGRELSSVIANDPGVPKMNFPVVGGIPFDAKEAAHLANGQPVQKVVEGRKVWFTKDFHNPNGLQQRSFNLDRAIREWDIKEMKHPEERKKLLATLRSGGTANVTLVMADGREEKMQVKVRWDADKLIFNNEYGQYVDPYSLQWQNSRAKEIRNTLQEHTQTLQLRTGNTVKVH